jgi:acyl-CoA reductase-like NAD-dependent aldehyde dehydrogenase
LLQAIPSLSNLGQCTQLHVLYIYLLEGLCSELASHTAAKLTELVPKFLDPECVQFVNGDKDAVTELLEYPFGHIIYTGSGPVGSIVMAAAAKHLTPVTLELGGKSPVIVSDKANIALAAKRISWGKFFNAGQTCMCPDYALVQEEVVPQFLEELKKVSNPYLARPKMSLAKARI